MKTQTKASSDGGGGGEVKSLSFLNVSACSYEGSLFGFSITENREEIGLELDMSYGFHASRGSLKALSCSSSCRYLVSGGMDERIRIFDMHNHCAVGELTNHTGAVTCLQFYRDAYLFSGSEDCNICIWRVYDWQCVHILGGHKGAVIDVTVHPSGKLALSISKDNTLKLWNLVQGRCSFTRRLKQQADQVSWHASGDFYMLVSSKSVQVFRASDNSCMGTCALDSRINKACFTQSSKADCCLVSSSSLETKGEDGFIEGCRVAAVCEDKTISIFDMHGRQTGGSSLGSLGVGRPRDLCSSTGDIASVEDQDMKELLRTAGDCLVVATSTGQVIVLSTSMLESLDKSSSSDGVSAALLSVYQIKAEPRLTAIIAWNPAAANKPAGSVDPPLSKKQHVSLYDYDVATDDEVEESQPVKKKMKKGEKKGEKKKSRNEQESRS